MLAFVFFVVLFLFFFPSFRSLSARSTCSCRCQKTLICRGRSPPKAQRRASSSPQVRPRPHITSFSRVNIRHSGPLDTRLKVLMMFFFNQFFWWYTYNMESRPLLGQKRRNGLFFPLLISPTILHLCLQRLDSHWRDQ